MIDDFLVNLLASLAYDLLKSLPSRFQGQQEDLLRNLRAEDELLTEDRPVALLGVLGGGKTTTLHYLTWAYAPCNDDPDWLLRPADMARRLLPASISLQREKVGVQSIHPRRHSLCPISPIPTEEVTR